MLGAASVETAAGAAGEALAAGAVGMPGAARMESANPGGSSSKVYCRITSPLRQCRSTRKFTTGSVKDSEERTASTGRPWLSWVTLNVVEDRNPGRSVP